MMTTDALTEARERIQLDCVGLVCAWRCAVADSAEHEIPEYLRERLRKLDASYQKYEKAREAYLATVRPMGVQP